MTVSDILLDMDARRNRQDAEAQRRRDAFMAENPALSELLGRKNALLVELLGRRLSPDGGGEDAQARIDGINAEIAARYGADWQKGLEPVRECAACGDTGYVERGGAKRMCGCLLDRVFKEIYGGADVGLLEGSFAGFDESRFQDARQRELMRSARDVAKKSVSKQLWDYFVLMGKSGLGKTFLMGAMAKELKAKGQSVLFIDAFSLFSVFHRHRLGGELPIAPVYEADALFIDDLGTEPMTLNVTREYLFRLLVLRAQEHRLTAISTNLTSEQLSERYTEKVSSRLFARDMSMPIRLEGRDIRL